MNLVSSLCPVFYFTKFLFSSKVHLIYDIFISFSDTTESPFLKAILHFYACLSLHHVRLFATPWTVAHQAPPSTGFSRQEYRSRLPFPPPGELPNLGIKPVSPALQADSLPLIHLESLKACSSEMGMVVVVGTKIITPKLKPNIDLFPQ